MITEYHKDKRFIVSFILSTLLNNISEKKDGLNLFDAERRSKAFVLIDLALYVYAFCPCFDHSQKVISMIVYINDELNFKKDKENHDKLLALIRRYSFVFQKLILMTYVTGLYFL